MSDKSIMGLSLWQPWATLMEIGAKTNETRSWYTAYRGPLAILSAKKWGWEFHRLCREGAYARALSPHYDLSPGRGGSCPRPLPLGAILCVVDLIDCVRIGPTNTPTEDEREFGDYTPGRFAWITRNVRRPKAPIPWAGAQGLFEIPLAIRELFEIVGQAPTDAPSLFEVRAAS